MLSLCVVDKVEESEVGVSHHSFNCCDDFSLEREMV